MSTSSRAYHHGSLRDTLLAEGLELVETSSPDAISMRELARRAGVSPTAVYRHFPDKSAFMAALAGEGLTLLGVAQHEAFERAGGGLEGFGATGTAYVRFALAHPTLFRLIFQHPVASALSEPAEQRPDAMSFLLANARAFAPGGVDAEVFALQAWSLSHGLAMLMLDRQIPADAASIDAVIEAHVARSRPVSDRKAAGQGRRARRTVSRASVGDGPPGDLDAPGG